MIKTTQLKTLSLEGDDKGIVSLLVTLILMIVISLIVLGFAQIARRTQYQQLDNSLSTQAYYAAESGVNDVDNIINTSPAGSVITKNSCANNGIYSVLGSGSPPMDQLSSTVSYTCVTVNPTIQTITLKDVGNTSWIIPIKPQGGALDTLTLTWQAIGVSHPWSGCPNKLTFPNSSATNWTCGFGVLRTDLVPTSGTNSQAQLEESDMTNFIQPDKTGINPNTKSIGYPATTPVSVTNKDNVVGLKCIAQQCKVNFTGLALQGPDFYLRVSSIYKDVSLQITGSSGGNPVSFSGAQIAIDSTGKANGVLRRIQVMIPQGVFQNALPDNAMESTDSNCKRFSVMTGKFIDGMTGIGVTGSNPLCN